MGLFLEIFIVFSDECKRVHLDAVAIFSYFYVKRSVASPAFAPRIFDHPNFLSLEFPVTYQSDCVIILARRAVFVSDTLPVVRVELNELGIVVRSVHLDDETLTSSQIAFDNVDLSIIGPGIPFKLRGDIDKDQVVLNRIIANR